MDAHCPMAARSGSGECHNLGAVKSFESKTGGGHFQTKNVIGAVAYNLRSFHFTL